MTRKPRPRTRRLPPDPRAQAEATPPRVERPSPQRDRDCPFAGFNRNVDLPDDLVRAYIRQQRVEAEQAGRKRVLDLLAGDARDAADAKSARPDLGPGGGAALARPVIDTEVVTRGHGRVVARSVLTAPLDVYAHDGHLSGAQLEAGHRVAKALRSWQAPRVTARYPVASDPGLDDDTDDLDEEQREKQRANRWATRAEAERIVGPRAWPTVRAVCDGYWLGRLGSMATLRDGLQSLVVAWKLERKVA